MKLKQAAEQLGKLVLPALKIAKKRGVKNPSCTMRDVGDIYHVHGVNAKPSHLATLIINRETS